MRASGVYNNHACRERGLYVSMPRLGGAWPVKGHACTCGYELLALRRLVVCC